MHLMQAQAIYVLWLRQMKRFTRSPSRLVATFVQPLFFLVIFGAGLSTAIFPSLESNPFVFLAPGIVGMAILFSSMFTGVSVLWDRQFGFLQEVLVAPVRRFVIILGQTFGGATVALLQGFIILLIALFFGVQPPNILSLVLTFIFMILIAFTAVGFGLVMASKIQDFQGFQLIMNLILLPLFFLSSAFFPIAQAETFPQWIRTASFFNPLFYMVDGLRGSLIGVDNIFPPLVDLGVVFLLCCIFLGLGSYFFSKSVA